MFIFVVCCYCVVVAVNILWGHVNTIQKFPRRNFGLLQLFTHMRLYDLHLIMIYQTPILHINRFRTHLYIKIKNCWPCGADKIAVVICNKDVLLKMIRSEDDCANMAAAQLSGPVSHSCPRPSPISPSNRLSVANETGITMVQVSGMKHCTFFLCFFYLHFWCTAFTTYTILCLYFTTSIT